MLLADSAIGARRKSCSGGSCRGLGVGSAAQRADTAHERTEKRASRSLCIENETLFIDLAAGRERQNPKFPLVRNLLIRCRSLRQEPRNVRGWQFLHITQFPIDGACSGFGLFDLLARLLEFCFYICERLTELAKFRF